MSSRVLSFGQGGNVGAVSDKLSAEILQLEDCDLLHAGLDEMRKNTNPFTGGINFDESRLNSTIFHPSDHDKVRALVL